MSRFAKLDVLPVVIATIKMPEMFNGYKVRYKLPSDYVNMDTAFRTNDLQIKRLSDKNKKNLAIASLWSQKHDSEGYYYSGIVADFDKLPQAYSDWHEFKLDMCSRYGNISAVNTSVSGKVKLFFPAKSKNRMTGDVALAYLKSILNPEDFDIIDNSHAALCCSYMNEHILDGINLMCAMEFVDIGDIKNKIQTTTRYYSYKGKIPQFFKFFIGNEKAREQFVRALLSCHNLIENRGFGLSQTVLAAQCGVSTGSISKWLKTLQDMKLLDCVDANWEYKKKAKIYKASWMLATAIAEAKKELLMEQKRQPNQVVAYRLVSSEAYFYLINAVKTCKSIDSIKDEILGLTPSGLSLSKRIWRTHERYGRLDRAS